MESNNNEIRIFETAPINIQGLHLIGFTNEVIQVIEGVGRLIRTSFFETISVTMDGIFYILQPWLFLREISQITDQSLHIGPNNEIYIPHSAPITLHGLRLIGFIDLGTELSIVRSAQILINNQRYQVGPWMNIGNFPATSNTDIGVRYDLATSDNSSSNSTYDLLNNGGIYSPIQDVPHSIDSLELHSTDQISSLNFNILDNEGSN